MNFRKSCLAVMLFATLVGLGSAFADCSNATLNGAYGFIVAGSAYGEPGTAAGQIIFDGKGNVSGLETTSFYGAIHTVPLAGTYSVAKNCTGNAGPYVFVLDNNNKGAQVIIAANSVVYPGYAVAQDAATCPANQKTRTFAANLSGTVVGVGAVAIVSQLSIDGNGNVTGNGIFDIHGTISSGPISGTYTYNSSCLGTAQITPQGLSTMNLNTVEVSNGKQLLLIETDDGTVVSGTFQQ